MHCHNIDTAATQRLLSRPIDRGDAPFLIGGQQTIAHVLNDFLIELLKLLQIDVFQSQLFFNQAQAMRQNTREIGDGVKGGDIEGYDVKPNPLSKLTCASANRDTGSIRSKYCKSTSNP